MMQERRMIMKVLFWIFFVLLNCLFTAVLELNKNTMPGWVMLVTWIIVWLLFYRRRAVHMQWFVKGLAWISYIGVFALILRLTWPPVRAVPAVNHKNPVSTDVYETQYGPVSGVFSQDQSIEVFAGIPYAAPPVDELRWKAPQDPESWTEVRVCDHFAPMSMQSTNLPIYNSLAQIIGYHDYQISLHDNYREPVSEDSLYLNIWKPAGDVKDCPVAVYIHGGSLQTGQPWYADYSGEGYAKDGVICVNMGYRLGVFGFLADEQALKEDGTSGNYGLLDQIKALQWVKDNIASFGGDPDNITVIGESAGAVCVDALCVSPLASGLFDRAILESSTVSSVQPPHSYRTLEEALASSKELLARYNCATLDDLRKIPAEQIVGEQETQHHVTIDGTVLPDSPYALRRSGMHNESALLHGFNTEESGPFIIFSHASMKNYEDRIRTFFGEYADEVLALYPAKNDIEADRYWAQIYGAVFFNYSHYCLNRLAVESDIPVYEYLFSKHNGRLSSWHSGEMVYTFGVIPEGSKLYDAYDRQLSDIMHAYWVRFVTAGDPNSPDLPLWQVNTDSQRMMEFGDEVRMIHEPYLKLYEIMDRMQGFES